jgi:hypothetical protein
MNGQDLLFWVQIINTVVQSASLVFLVIYVVKTWQMASSTRMAAEATELSVQEMRAMRDEETSPHVIVHFEITQDRLIYLVVKNIGKGTAVDVRLDFDPPLKTPDNFTPINEISMVKDGIASMPPEYELRTLLGTSVDYFGNNNFPLRYSVVVSYFGGIRSDQRVVSQILDLSAHKNLMYVKRKGIHELNKQLEELVKGQSKVTKALDRLARIADTGIFINNPRIATSVLDIDRFHWKDTLLAMLGEFSGVWSGPYREDRENGIIPPYLKARLFLISEQIFFMLAIAPNTVNKETTNKIMDIAAQIGELGNMQFYGDGGYSLNKFNDLGNKIGIEISNVVEMDLLEKHA